MLPCVCSVMHHGGCQNMVRTSVTHLAIFISEQMHGNMESICQIHVDIFIIYIKQPKKKIYTKHTCIVLGKGTMYIFTYSTELLLNMDNKSHHLTCHVRSQCSIWYCWSWYSSAVDAIQVWLAGHGFVMVWILFCRKNAAGSVNATLSKKCNLCCGVQQGLCLGPLLFTIYTRRLIDILKPHLPSVRHIYGGRRTAIYII